MAANRFPLWLKKIKMMAKGSNSISHFTRVCCHDSE